MIYEVVSAGDTEELKRLVNELLSCGWRCQGGVFVIEPSGRLGIDFYQAMIKDDQLS